MSLGLNGSELALWVHAANGASAGPVLVLLSTLHGGEWTSIAPLRTVLNSVDAARLSGTLLVVPVAGPTSLVNGTRNVLDDSESPDLNRIFPGRPGWTGDRIIHALSQHVLARATHVLDFHPGPWGSALRNVIFGVDYPDANLADVCEGIALAFGSPLVRRMNVATVFPGPKSSIGYAGAVLGIPALGVEVGGAGFGEAWGRRWHDDTVAGIRAVMRRLGMLAEGPDPRPARQLVFSVGHRVSPTSGGFLRTYLGADAIGKAVAKGDLLGDVHSPYTFGKLEELRAPVNGILYCVTRDHAVHPGDWAFAVASLEAGAPRWVENPPRTAAS